MGKAKMDPVIADEVPWSDHVTEYDEEHFITYLRLLDADAEGARPPYGPRGPQRSSSFSKFTINSYERLQEWLEQYDPICLHAALGYRFPNIFEKQNFGRLPFSSGGLAKSAISQFMPSHPRKS
jgi:hypothetical protein